MKSDSIETLMLFDCYSGMLTDKQQTCFDLYYNQDFSLSEIAEECGISRQGVHDTISRTETALREMESKLHLADREKKIRAAVSELRTAALALETDRPDAAEQILAAVDMLEKEN